MAVVAVLGGIAAVGTAASIDQSKKAARASKKAAQVETNIRQGAERESTNQAIREQMIRRSRVLSASENTGSTGSSSVVGSLGALDTRTGSNIAFNRGQELGNIAIGNFNQQAADALTKASTFSAVSGLAMQGASLAMAMPKKPAKTG